MTKYYITIYSKNEESLSSFLNFLKNTTKQLNSKIPLNVLRKQKIKKRITVLKSPHVNKIAQEHFGYAIYSIKISFYSWSIKRYLLFFKKVKSQLFSDIKIKIEGKFAVKKRIVVGKFFNPDNVTIQFFKSDGIKQNKIKDKLAIYGGVTLKNKNALKKTITYLKILDCYGNLA